MVAFFATEVSETTVTKKKSFKATIAGVISNINQDNACRQFMFRIRSLIEAAGRLIGKIN